MLILFLIAVTAVIVHSIGTIRANGRIIKQNANLAQPIIESYDAVGDGRIARIEETLAEIKSEVARSAGPAERFAGLADRLDDAVDAMPQNHHTAA